jgi:ABC-type lipoprotein release transport system permease subunit
VLARFRYYTSLAIRDLLRMWSSTQHHVVIVAGICLPILLLLGLKRGHVEELRRELITSPTGRQILFWTSQDGELLDARGIDALQQTLPQAELMIPDQQRVVMVQATQDAPPLTVTLYSSRKGDPILRQCGSDVLEKGEKAIVVPSNVADALGVSVGKTLELTVRREVNGQDDTAVGTFLVKAIYPAGGDRADIGYVDSDILSYFEQFVRGYAVPDLNWKAAPIAAPDTYAAYLYLFEKGQSLSRDDEEYLATRGLKVEEIDVTQQWELSNFFTPEAAARICGLRIFSEASRVDPARRLAIAPSELTEILSIPDDVAIPWNQPLDVTLDGQKALCVGLSLPRRCWLRKEMVAEGLAFPFDADSIGITWPFRAALSSQTATLHLEDGKSLAVSQTALGLDSNTVSLQANAGSDPEITPAADCAVVPVDFLARLTSLTHGAAIFDPQTQLIAPVPVAVVFDKVRLFARTIDDVPSLTERLFAAKFAVQSEDARIQEIQEQDASLRLLVLVVGLGVFLFGVLTVISVLVDSTDRKRGTLGILRVMGVSKLGIFWIVVLRAAAIGFFSGCLSVIFGKLLAVFLGWTAPADSLLAVWKPTVRISLQPQDVLLVFLGALVCACVGALYPALRASRIDPFDAIVEGRFK